MKSQNKRGFTLIELLAVIVIIGLVAVIAVPITINIVESSKRESVKSSVVIASGEIEYYMMENDIDDIPEDGIDITKLELKDNFESGRFIEKDGEIEAYFIKDKEYCVNGPIKKLKIAKIDECYKVDNTAAKVDKSKYHLSSTSKSITVTIEEELGIDPESGIKEYKVKIDGKEKIIEGKYGQVIFEGLKNETEYKVEIIIVNRNNIETKIEDKIKTKTINTPIYLIDKTGWAQSKVVTIDYQDEKNQYEHEYSIDSGEKFNKYEKAIEFKENGTVIARVNDGVNYVTSSSQTVANIDRTAPTSATFTYTKTSKSIKVTANAVDNESGIYGYQFSKDDGATWTSIQKENIYTFENLKTGIYKIKVKVINNTYENEGINSLNSKESTTESIETTKIDVPTYAINKTGWAQSKKVTITYPNGYTNEYSIDGGEKFTKYEQAIEFKENGTVIARVNDGVNYVTGSSQTVTNIDRTAPTSATFTYTKTSKSITVTASGTDSESGIYGYQFSKDDGATWTSIQTGKTYTFDKLKTGTYKVKVKVINNTYNNEGINNLNSKDSSTESIATTTIDVPTYAINKTGWSQSKKVTITYPSGYTNEYSIDSGTTFKTYSSAIEFTSEGTVIARVNDGTNYVTGSSQTVTNIDRTAPTSATFTYTKTSKSITVIASGTDSESGIYGYQFSKDDGVTWTSIQTGKTYTFDKLTTGTYKVKVKVINNTYNNEGINSLNSKASDTQSIETTKIDVPTYAINKTGWAQSKKVTITYPSGYTNEYSIDSGTTFKTYSSAIEFTSAGTVIARVNDGTNYVTGSSQTVTNIDRTAPTSATFTYTKTSKSITVTASGEDTESGIYGYQFSKDNGATWTSIQTGKTYTFDKLTTGTYTIKVKVINNTYKNEGINSLNSKDSISEAVPTTEITKPIYAIDKTGWSQSKVVTITYPTGYTNEYSLDGGESFELYKQGVEFTSAGTVIARVNDGTNYVSGTSQSITQIDRTKPTKSSLTYEMTTKSITITASGTDSESGIYGYQFSKDDGATWTSIQTGKTYTFSNIKTGSYKLKVRTVNGTYQNEGINSLNYLDSSTYNVSTTALCAPTYTITPSSGWAQSKKVKITNPSGCPSGTLEYSLDGGTTFKTYSSEVTFTSNGTIIGRITDGVNYVTGSSQTITSIDTTAPTSSTFSYTRTSKSITVVASGTDSESGIYGYQFSKDGGTTWTSIQTTNSYTFNNLTSGTYKIKTRVINKTYTNNGLNSKNYLDSSVQSIATTTISAPTYTVTPEGWAKSKTVTIDYKDTDNKYTHEYSLDGGTTFKTYSGAITFTSNGTIIARVNDGTNYVTGSSQTVSGIDTTAPSCTNTISAYTLSSMTVKMSCTDKESGLNKYYYSIDGTSYVESTSSSYTFNSLHASTVKLKITDTIGNSTEYTLSSSELEKFYNNIYTLLNNKYTELVNNQFLASHPIGSIYITIASDENTAAKIASKYGGTWEAFGTNRVLRGTTGTASSTGGASTVTLTTSYLPSHTHSISHTHATPATTISSSGAHTHSTGTGTASYSLTSNSTGSHTHGLSTGSDSLFIGIDTTTCSSGQGYELGYVNTNLGGYWYNVNKNVSSKTASGGGHEHSISGTISSGTLSIASSGAHKHTVPAMTTGAASTSNSGSTGSGGSFSVLDPYITVYMYKRVS